MIDAASYLRDLLGREPLEQPRSFDVPVPGGRRPAVFDAWNRRVKVFGPTVAEFRGSSVARLLAGADPGTWFTKLTVYARDGDDGEWADLGFREEARIEGFFADGSPARLVACYADPRRAEEESPEVHDRIVRLARSKAPRPPSPAPGYGFRTARAGDAPGLATLLRDTFPDYPVPIDPSGLGEAIEQGRALFRLAAGPEGEIAACASAEPDRERGNAELTDCATRPDHRGRGLLGRLLADLEDALAADPGITDLYTIARADEPGVNCAFARRGYAFTGRLVKNCRMPNGWESMNVWCRNSSAETPPG